MSAPTVSSTTETLYARLPQHYLDADERVGDPALGTDYPLLRFLSLLGDGPADEVVAFIEANADAGALADPYATPARALAWLAQRAGVDLAPYRGEEQQRGAIAEAPSSRSAGSTAAVLAAVRPLLIESRTARVIVRDPARFAYRVQVFARETPDRVAVERVLQATRPAGLLAELEVARGQTWGELAQRGLTLGQLRTFTARQVREAIPGQPIVYGGPL